MIRTHQRNVLITGANSGLGKDIARQLAIQGTFKTIYLACRNEAKAQAAKTDLEHTTGESNFHVVLMDTSVPASVKSAIRAIDEPLDTIVMNAGGDGGPTPLALTAQGATEIFASNVLGHVVLLEDLINQGALTTAAVFTGSDVASGLPKLGIKRPSFIEHSVEEFTSVIDGSFFQNRKFSRMLAYSQVKYLGTLWMSSLARKHRNLRLVTMSPGMTAGTSAFRDAGFVMKPLMQHVLVPYIAPALRLGHKLEVGAKRLVDAVVDDGYRSGIFYASAANPFVGPVMDQTTGDPEFNDETFQDHADQAIHRFVPDPQ